MPRGEEYVSVEEQTPELIGRPVTVRMEFIGIDFGV
jgi:hypothetical protein